MVFGPDNLLINAKRAILLKGSDEWLQLNEIIPHIGRPEERRTTTDGGVQYFYGSGDNYFEAVVNGTTDALEEFNTLTKLDADGNPSVNEFTIRLTARDNTVKNMVVQVVVREFTLDAPEEGFSDIRTFFRIITDSITVTP